MLNIGTSRPRNIDWQRAAGILYGDWGTSKAYVIGLAFAAAGYSAFWLILPMCLLTLLVGMNYMTICRLYPNGGGVYASVRHRSEIISIVGAFLLIADYLVTAAVSALAAFEYLGVAHPSLYAAIAILVIGFLNIFGPKHTGMLAVFISVPTAIVVVILGIFALPHLGEAIHHLSAPSGGVWHNWTGFVSIVLTLSGVEAIANNTGVMKLNPGSSPQNPVVTKTANKAIWVVLLEVVGFTLLLGLGMMALPHLTVINGQVNAPGASGVRDYMLRYMAHIFVGNIFGSTIGWLAAWSVSIVFGLLLLSAVNTALTGLISICFLMSKDEELPPIFAKINQFGVPVFSLVIVALIPAGLVIAIKDLSGLADLYAVGVVGAIATNLAATFTDKNQPLRRRERLFMGVTCFILVIIEITLFIQKPSARVFTMTILAIGLILRGLAREHTARKKARFKIPKNSPHHPQATHYQPQQEALQKAPEAFNTHTISVSLDLESTSQPHHGAPILVAVRGIGKTLNFALREARETNRPLYVMFVRQQTVIAPEDRKRSWQDDKDAAKIFTSLEKNGLWEYIFPCYAVSDSPPDTIADLASTIGAERVIIGASQRGALMNMLRGDMISTLSRTLPEEIYLVVCG